MSSTGGTTPATMLEKLLGSPRKAGSPTKPGGSPNKSPEKIRNPRIIKPKTDGGAPAPTGKGKKINISRMDKLNNICYKLTKPFYATLIIKYLTSVDPKLGPQRKTAGVRNLPKIDRSARIGAKGGKQRQQGKAALALGGKVEFETNGQV